MASNGAVTIPVAGQETQPLLNNQPAQPVQQPFRCRRGPLCKRCLAGTHEAALKRKYMRRTAFAMFIVWFFYLSFGFPRFGFSNDKGECRGSLVPWQGRNRFESEKAFINSMFVLIGKGDIAGNVDIQISSDVHRPTVLVDAKVRENDQHVLHLQVEEDNGIFRFHIWADVREHHHGRKTCAQVSVKVLFPATMATLGTLSVQGTVVDIRTWDLGSLQLSSVDLTTVVGKIEAGSLLASRLQATATDGPITISHIEGLVDKRLSLDLQTNVGAIRALAVVRRLAIDHHDINIRSHTGSILLDVQQRDHTRNPGNYGPLPGNLLVKATSEVGHVVTNIAVLEGQALMLGLSSATSTLDATVTDTYLGRINLMSEFGRLEITELLRSRTVIEYEENNRKKKVARKFFRDGRYSDVSGSIYMNSNVGKANLKFVRPEY
ncbi:hypothetical protein EMPS_02646 [Entomortierella parvispora]|uniref:Adhesin domain-containing protein n=1 Tax=Entomortierella parvispora TaxID=205924 RepID=A0A9P3LTV1_9FUNG|nr:hypothetical protein EMPS_02646 [Entomortierella parvispora]